ncbi:hypothetical protein [Phascolarctobacterium sp.]
MHFTSKKKIALVLALSIMAIVSVLSVDIDLCVEINKDIYYDGQEQGLSGGTSINNSNFAGKRILYGDVIWASSSDGNIYEQNDRGLTKYKDIVLLLLAIRVWLPIVICVSVVIAVMAMAEKYL